jgi:hypothetical protein
VIKDERLIHPITGEQRAGHGPKRPSLYRFSPLPAGVLRQRIGFSVFDFLCYTYEMRLLVEVLLHFWEMIKGVQTEWQYKWEASSREK